MGYHTFYHKDTTSKDFEEMHQVVLDGIRNNMSVLAQSGMYGAMNTTDSITRVYYTIKFFS